MAAICWQSCVGTGGCRGVIVESRLSKALEGDAAGSVEGGTNVDGVVDVETVLQ